MNIQDATKKALESGRGITRQEYMNKRKTVFFMPTNTNYRTIIVSEKIMDYGWQPSLDDLIANDWIVYG